MATCQRCLCVTRGAGRVDGHVEGTGMDRQGEAAAVTDPAAAMRNSGPAIARIGDHDTSQITVGVGNSYRHLPDRHAGTWVSASCPEFWRDRRSRAWRQAAARSDIHYREGQDGYPYPYLAWSAGQSLHTCRTQQAFVWFLTVVAAQLFVLRRLAGHRRTTGVALAAATWAAAAPPRSPSPPPWSSSPSARPCFRPPCRRSSMTSPRPGPLAGTTDS